MVDSALSAGMPRPGVIDTMAMPSVSWTAERPYGTYDADTQEVIIRPDMDNDGMSRKVTLAHELLHHAYAQMSDKGRAIIDSTAKATRGFEEMVNEYGIRQVYGLPKQELQAYNLQDSLAETTPGFMKTFRRAIREK
jgi:hypothetical protein